MHSMDSCVADRKLMSKWRYYNPNGSVQMRLMLNVNLKLSVLDRKKIIKYILGIET